MKVVALVLLLAICTSCVSVGTEFSWSQIDDLKPGVTTKADVVKTIGEPYSVENRDDGTQLVTWVYAQAAGFSGSSRGVEILFDKDGKMIRVNKRTKVNE